MSDKFIQKLLKKPDSMSNISFISAQLKKSTKDIQLSPPQDEIAQYILLLSVYSRRDLNEI